MPRRFPIGLWAGMGLMGLAIIIAAVTMLRPDTPAPALATPTLASIAPLTDTSAPDGAPTTLPTSTQLNAGAPGTTFRDEFENQLAGGWTWLAEDPARWSLTEVPGWLQILASDASFDGPSFPTNVLLREPPPGDFEITTVLRFAPTSNFQFAGLVVFQDKANVLQYGRAFCDLAEACSGGGIYFDNMENGSITGSSPMISIDNPVVYLRLRRVENTYMGYYSEDGETWTLLGEHIRDFSQARIGLMAAQAAEAIPAEFDYFTLTSLSE